MIVTVDFSVNFIDHKFLPDYNTLTCSKIKSFTITIVLLTLASYSNP